MPHQPPTIIVVHRRENRKKCSVEPLREHGQFVFWTYPDNGPESLDGYVRLGIGGPLLSEADRSCGLLVIDGTWRLAERMEKKYADLPIRSLPPCQTAYPRVSKVFDDPTAGLATIEAIYLAYHLLGRDTSTLLDHYRCAPSICKKTPSYCQDDLNGVIRLANLCALSTTRIDDHQGIKARRISW